MTDAIFRGAWQALGRPGALRLRQVDDTVAASGKAALVVGGATVFAHVIILITGETRLATIFLVSVLLSSLYLGIVPGIISAILAFAAYNFVVLPPRFAWSSALPNAVIVQSMFLLTAVAAGGMAAKVRAEGRRAITRADTMSTLFAASRQFSEVSEEGELRRLLATHMAKACGGEAMVVDDHGNIRRAPGDGEGKLEPLVLEFAEAGVGGWSCKPLASGDVSLGVALWRSEPDRGLDCDEVSGLVSLLVDLGAAAMARCRLDAEKAQMQALARTEQLRSALLASISHDLRTPLSTILASATSLIDYHDQFKPALRRELLGNIRGEAQRLNRFFTNLFDMTRLESGALKVKREPINLIETLTRLIGQVGGADPERTIAIDRRGEPTDANVFCDPFLLDHALMNVLENAVAFSPAGASLSARIYSEHPFTVLELSDCGPGVPVAERERIFEKFYRAKQQPRGRQGTGLGLSISRGLVEAMGGTISAHARSDGHQGLEIRIVVPGTRVI